MQNFLIAGEEINLGEVINYILKLLNIDYELIDDNEYITNDFLDNNNLKFYKDDDSYLIRLSTFDLNKSNNIKR